MFFQDHVFPFRNCYRSLYPPPWGNNSAAVIKKMRLGQITRIKERLTTATCMCRRRFLYHKNNYGHKICLPYMYMYQMSSNLFPLMQMNFRYFLFAGGVWVLLRGKNTLLRNQLWNTRELLSVLSKISGARGYQASAKSCWFVNYCNELRIWICFGVTNSAFYYIAIFTCVSLKLAK